MLKPYTRTIVLIVVFFSITSFSNPRNSNIYQEAKNSVSLTDTLMPVELIYFYGLVSGQDILLKWGTATENNNFGFDIERSYQSPANFETIDFVLGSGTSNIPIDYEFLDTTVSDAGMYYYRLKQIDIIGTFEYSDTISVDFISSVIFESDEVPSDYFLSQNYPNPFNPSTKIEFRIPEYQNVSADLFDVQGRLIQNLIYENLYPGTYSLTLDLSDHTSGTYFFKFTSGKFSSTKKLLFLK